MISRSRSELCELSLKVIKLLLFISYFNLVMGYILKIPVVDGLATLLALQIGAGEGSHIRSMAGNEGSLPLCPRLTGTDAAIQDSKPEPYFLTVEPEMPEAPPGPW